MSIPVSQQEYSRTMLFCEYITLNAWVSKRFSVKICSVFGSKKHLEGRDV